MENLTSMRDLVQGFAGAMNLIDQELQNHHEKVAYLAICLAEQMGLGETERRLAFFGALMHDIGGIVKGQGLSLLELEREAGELAVAGAGLLRTFSATETFSEVVAHSQTPWRLVQMPARLKTAHLIGQIIHLSDVVALMLEENQSVLNQVEHIRACVNEMKGTEFSPQVLAAFDALCGRESVWMDLLYRSQRFLDYIPADREVSLEEAVALTGFMSRIIDFRSPFTAMHSAGVAETAVCLAEILGMSRRECQMMRIAGNLHDVGKLKIPNEILEKPGKLTDWEFNVMKEHVYYTYIILKDIRGFEQIAAWAAFHHEKLDGGGYPFHLEADQLPLGARVMAVADVFSAITEDRPYRKAMEKEKVISILREDAGNKKLSPEIVGLLIGSFDEINCRRDTASRAASRKYQESLRRQA